MKNEVIITAKTVDEAMAQARRDYSSSENELAFEILEMPKKGTRTSIFLSNWTSSGTPPMSPMM